MEDDKLANHLAVNPTNNHSNGHSATGPALLINGTSNGGQVNGASVSSYENALKKLVHILKLKANDNLKQLEDLWDSINAPPPSHNTQASANRPVSKSGGNSNNSLSPRTTPSPPLFNSSSCSNSSSISESSSQSPSPTSSSSSSSSSPPHVPSSSKPKQPLSSTVKSEATATLKRDASKLSTPEGQEPKKTKLTTTGSNTSAKKPAVPTSAVSKTAGVKPSTVGAAKKDDKAATKPPTTASKTTAKSSSKTVKELTSSKSSLKRELDTTPDVQLPSQSERPSSFGNVALVSVKEEELNKLEEGKSIEISFDTSVMIEASSTSTGSVFTSPGSGNQSEDPAIGNAKRFKLDLDQPSNVELGVSNGASTSEMNETTQVDLDDMLTGLSCSVCKKFNQENNNKLIECRNCKYMFHQLCHRPPLAPEELEEQSISKCLECSVRSFSSKSGAIELTREGSVDEPKDFAVGHSKEPSSSTTTPILNSPGGGNVKQAQGQQLFAVKGLAALATKFNPTQTPSATSVSSKNNDLFNKFKQSASTTSLASTPSGMSSPNESSSNNLLAKNKNPFIQTAQPVALSATQQQLQQQKRNIFNIASTTGATNAIPVTVATPSGDKRAK